MASTPALPYPQSKANCVDLLKQILAFLPAHPDVALTPHVYAVLFEHLSGTNPALSSDLNGRLGTGSALQAAHFEELHQRHIAPPESDTGASAERFRRLMEQASAAASRTSHATESYQRDLDELTVALGNSTAPEGLQPQLAEVSHRTRAMRAAVQSFGEATAGTLTEIQVLQAELAKARLEAVTDPLSQLLNRRGLQEVVNEVLSKADTAAVPPCLLVLDIDHFKKVNDTFGHQTGDAVIARVASTVRENIGPGSYAARVGGEEFVVLLQDTSLEGACQVAERIREQSSARLAIRDRNTGRVQSHITLSAGVSALQAGEDYSQLERRADAALYQAKQSGRNRVMADGAR